MDLQQISVQLNHIDSLIQSGQAALARDHLLPYLKANTKDLAKLSSNVRTKMFNLLRRSGWISEALDLNQPFIRGEISEILAPTADEKIEYAAALVNMGLEIEALSLLNNIRKSIYPMAAFIQATAYIRSWNYNEAQIHLEHFLSIMPESNYYYRVAELNLAACYLANQNFDLAEKYLLHLAEKFKTEKLFLLYSNALEELSQVYIHKNQFEKAEHIIHLAEANEQDKKSVYSLLVQKWKFVLKLLKSNENKKNNIFDLGSNENIYIYNDIIKQSFRLRQFEIIRDLQLQIAKIFSNHNLLLRLYCGTPYLSYKEKIKSLLDLDNLTHTPEFYFKAGPIYNNYFQVSDNYKLNKDSVTPVICESQDKYKIHRALNIIMSDFYSPWDPPRLFQKLFPDRWYDRKSAINVLYQTVFHLRKDLNKNNSALNIEWKNNLIYLTGSQDWLFKPSVVVIMKNKNIHSVADYKQDQLLNELINFFGWKDFNVEMCFKITNIPKRSLQRHLKNLVEKKILNCQGKGKATRYNLVANSK